MKYNKMLPIFPVFFNWIEIPKFGLFWSETVFQLQTQNSKYWQFFFLSKDPQRQKMIYRQIFS